MSFRSLELELRGDVPNMAGYSQFTPRSVPGPTCHESLTCPIALFLRVVRTSKGLQVGVFHRYQNDTT